jgi:hypothetical protein
MMCPKQALNKKKNLTFSLILLLIPPLTIVFIYIGYTVYRSVELYSYIKSNQRGWIGKVMKADAELGFVPIPNSHGAEIFPVGPDLPLCFDENGFRSLIENNNAPSNQKPVVLFLGCSFTYGAAVYAKDAYPYLVGQSLGGITRNAGCSSCGLSQMLILARRLIPTHKPDYVVLQYSPWLVDRALDPFAPSFFGKAPTAYFYEDDGMAIHPPVFLTKLMDLPIDRYRNSPESVTDFISLLWNVGLPLLLYDDFHMSRYLLKSTFGLIPEPATNESTVVSYVYEEIAALAREENARLVIVVLGENYKPVEAPRHLLPADATIVEAHSALLERLPIVDKENYRKNYAHWRGSPPRIVDNHPNEKAHQIIAEEILLHITNSAETQ